MQQYNSNQSDRFEFQITMLQKGVRYVLIRSKSLAPGSNQTKPQFYMNKVKKVYKQIYKGKTEAVYTYNFFCGHHTMILANTIVLPLVSRWLHRIRHSTKSNLMNWVISQ